MPDLWHEKEKNMGFNKEKRMEEIDEEEEENNVRSESVFKGGSILGLSLKEPLKAFLEKKKMLCESTAIAKHPPFACDRHTAYTNLSATILSSLVWGHSNSSY
ncbi:hypothetical protein RIF29_20045 [Crotalaria pallida]|uniref:Uncharacterized protein n=1 Tax=Crotalaria pallida TaxID=3830 RepID=A0AAN9F0I9_CROPI